MLNKISWPVSDKQNSSSLLEFRQNSSRELNDEICEKFYSGELSEEKIRELADKDPEFSKIIKFVLEGFSHPKDPSKARRKDGSHIAVHSLQLYRTAKEFFDIKDKDVLVAVLVHDLIEDTLIKREEITASLGEKAGELAWSMTEEPLSEEFTGRAGNKDRASIAQFVKKLASGIPAVRIAEILDRIDDISDLKYLTDKLSDPQKREKARLNLIEKFGKCLFTVDSVAEDETRFKKNFHELLGLQIKKIKSQFGIELEEVEILKIRDEYQKESERLYQKEV